MSRRLLAPLAMGAMLALTACGASEPVPQAPSGGTGAPGTGGTSGAFPMTLQNCGQSVTLQAPPTKVVSLDQNSTEILLSLGLKDRIVGTASWTDPVLPSLAEANTDVPRLADNAPSYEVVMGTDPDFVTASFGRHFNQGGVAPRARFAETAIPTYLSPMDCEGGRSINGGGTRTKPVTTAELHQEIRELARIFDVAPRGEQLIADLDAREKKALQGVDGQKASVAFWFADTKTPYVAGSFGAANLLAEKAKLTNAFSDVSDDWIASTWEAVVKKDPQVLVLGDLKRDRFPGDRLDDKIAFLTADPLTKTLEAVEQKRFISLHGAEMNGSIRYVDGLEKIGAWWRENGARVD